MISPRFCETMAEYNAWMNAKMYTLCAGLSDTERKADRRAFFGSIHSTLNHILACDLMFLAMFTSGADFDEHSGDLHADFDDLRAQRKTVDAQLLQWSRTVSPDWLDTASTYVHHEDGIERHVPEGFWVLHMFNHQTHHRGQITTLLTQAGHDIGSTDLHMSVPA